METMGIEVQHDLYKGFLILDRGTVERVPSLIAQTSTRRRLIGLRLKTDKPSLDPISA